MFGDFTWENAHELYLRVFREMRSGQRGMEEKSLSEAAAFLRRTYHWRTYLIGRSFRSQGSLDDEVSAAWGRFIVHCLTAEETYRSFRHLVDYHVRGAFLDDWRARSAHKRNQGRPPLTYDESFEGEPVPGVVPAVATPSQEISSADVIEALDALATNGAITNLQRSVFLSYIYDGKSTDELIAAHKIAKATVFRYINHVGRMLRASLYDERHTQE